MHEIANAFVLFGHIITIRKNIINGQTLLMSKANFNSKQGFFFYLILILKEDFKKTAKLWRLVRKIICDKFVSFDRPINRLIGQSERIAINRLTILQSIAILN